MFNKYDVYTSTASLYCYKNSNVLKNKVGIRESNMLREMENEIVAVKQYSLIVSPLQEGLPRAIFIESIASFLETFILLPDVLEGNKSPKV